MGQICRAGDDDLGDLKSWKVGEWWSGKSGNGYMKSGKGDMKSSMDEVRMGVLKMAGLFACHGANMPSGRRDGKITRMWSRGACRGGRDVKAGTRSCHFSFVGPPRSRSWSATITKLPECGLNVFSSPRNKAVPAKTDERAAALLAWNGVPHGAPGAPGAPRAAGPGRSG